MMSSSMDPLIPKGTEIPVKEKLPGDEYNIGDIIAIDRGDGLYLMHQVTNKYRGIDGKIYYETQGLNRDTNPFPDTKDVSEDSVIGIADISKEAFIAMYESIEKRNRGFIKVFGISNHFDHFKSSLESIIRGFPNDKKILNALFKTIDIENFIEQIESGDHRKIVNSFLELTYKISNLDRNILGSHKDFGVPRGTIMSILKPQLIDLCQNYLVSLQHLSPQSYQLLEIFTEIAHMNSDKNGKSFNDFDDLNIELRMNHNWRYDIIGMIAEGTKLNNIHQKILAEYLIKLRNDFERRSSNQLKNLEKLTDVFTKIYGTENYFYTSQDYTGRMYEIQIEGQYGKNQAFKKLDEMVINALDIRDKNPTRQAILEKAKASLFGFDGSQVSLIKFYHKYKDGSVKAGYQFVYNGKQDMDRLTTKSLRLDMRLRINKNYQKFDRPINGKWRVFDSEAKAIKTFEYREDHSQISESYYEIWSEEGICPACEDYINFYIESHNSAIDSFTAYHKIKYNPEGEFIQFK